MRCLLLLFTVVLLSKAVSSSVRLCDTFPDYYNLLSKNCILSEMDSLNLTGLIKAWGFNIEEYHLTTPDGYIINVVRCFTEITRDNPIILGHGILISGTAWTWRGKQSLAYQLGSMGYDVWIINYRGTSYSRGHVKLSDTDLKYWRFSFHEMGIYDLRTVVDHVYTTTKKQAIYLGYSQGSTISYVYSSVLPFEAKQKLKGVMSFGPVGTVREVLRSGYVWPVVGVVWPLIRNIWFLVFRGRISVDFPVLIGLRRIIALSPGLMQLTNVFIGFVVGFDFSQMDPKTFPLLLLILPDTLGADCLTHYVQNRNSKTLDYFDYGKLKNREVYGSSRPPSYRWSEIKVPVMFFVGKNDIIANLKDARESYENFSNSSRCGYFLLEKFNHLDFISAKNISELLYPTFFKALHDLEMGKCQN